MARRTASSFRRAINLVSGKAIAAVMVNMMRARATGTHSSCSADESPCADRTLSRAVCAVSRIEPKTRAGMKS